MDLLIVTRDEKEDWWWRQQAVFVGPRPEVLKFVEALLDYLDVFRARYDEFQQRRGKSKGGW
jgi:hypothetical protein